MKADEFLLKENILVQIIFRNTFAMALIRSYRHIENCSYVSQFIFELAKGSGGRLSLVGPPEIIFHWRARQFITTTT